MRGKAVQGASALALAAVCSRALSFVSSLVLARLLLEEEVGVFAFSLGIVVIASKLGNFEARRDILRDPLTAPGRARAYLGVQGGIGLLLGALIFFLGPRLGTLLSGPGAGSGALLQSLCLLPLLEAAGLPAVALLESELRFRAAARLEGLAVLCQVLVTLCLAALGAGPYALVGGLYAAFLFRGLGAWVLEGRTLFGARAGKEDFRSVLTFGTTMLLAHLVVSLCMNLPEVLAGSAMGMAAAGIYKFAYMLPHAPEQIVEHISRVNLALLGTQKSRERQARIFAVATRFSLALLAPGLMLAWVHAEFLVGTLLGERWLEAALPFQVLVGLVVLRATFRHWMDVANVRGRPDMLPRAGLVTALALPPLGLLLMSSFGLSGMAWAALLAWALPLPWCVGWVKRELSIALLPLLLPGLCATLSGLSVGVLLLPLLGGGMARMPLMALQLLVYGIVLLRMDPELWTILREGLRRPGVAGGGVPGS